MKLPFFNEKLFGNLAGEDEDLSILKSSFYEHEMFNKFYEEDRKLSIVSARKGMGKSALLKFLVAKLESEQKYNNPLIIYVKGNDLLELGEFNGKDHSYLENYWKKVICKKIMITLGANIGIAFSSDDMTLVEMAELDGYKSKNFVGGLLSRFKNKIPKLEVEVTHNLPENYESILDRYFESHANQTVWILVDDIDSKFKNNEDYQNRVGSFFSAIRSLAFDFTNLRVRATVRSDVWACLRHLEDLDKIDQYIIEIFWNTKLMRYILAKKILSYIQRYHPDSKEAKLKVERDYNQLIEIVFESPIYWNEKNDAHIFDAINGFSNKRPRWMLQLCQISGVEAYEESKANKKVKLDHFQYALETFGRKRKDDLIKEHSHQFEELSQLIDAFRAMDKEFNYSYVIQVIDKKYIKGRDKSSIPKIDGVVYSHPEDLADFLYKLGIFSRIHEDRRKFTHFVDDPDLFKSIENQNDEITWSIHLAYRDFLKIR